MADPFERRANSPPNQFLAQLLFQASTSIETRIKVADRTDDEESLFDSEKEEFSEIPTEFDDLYDYVN